MPDIMHLLTIQTTPERVYEALTTSEGVRVWWTPDADLDTEVGGTGEFRFYGGSAVIRIQVDKLDPSNHVRWKTLSAFRPEWSVQRSPSIFDRAETIHCWLSRILALRTPTTYMH